MDTKTIIFIGPQGSGKGTQIERLKKVFIEKDPGTRVVDIQTGRRFRALAAREEGFTERHVAETLDSGTLQPLFLSVVLWGDAMREKLDPTCHMLVDGFPRTVPEAVVLESAFSFYERTHVTVVFLDTPEEVVRKRMELRARNDDTPQSIEARLCWYREETLPVVEYYRTRKSTTVLTIDGTKDIEGVHRDIVDGLSL